ncbi:MAG: tetratricopeptide repeat protein [Pseudomonadota bacterium]
MTDLCDDIALQGIVDLMNAEDPAANQNLDELLQQFPEDPRLHFMRGSILVGEGQHIDAHASLSRAVELAPDFNIARFQLGFFQLTSGEAEAALQTLEPLDAQLEEGHYLRLFALGLRYLIEDQFENAVQALEAGIARNQENAPLNRDMGLIIEECRPIISKLNAVSEDTSVSETSLVLNQFAQNGMQN